MNKDANKGITLIALVITIIVLLILAGISIATLTGENGILTKATTSKEESIKGEETEQIKLAYNAALADKMEKADGTGITADELKVELVKLEPDVTVNGSDTIIVTFSKSKNEYRVDSKGNVKENKMIHFTLDGHELSCSDGEKWYSFAVSGGLDWDSYGYSNFVKENGVELYAEEGYEFLVWVDEDTFESGAMPMSADGVTLGGKVVKVTDKIVNGASYVRSGECPSSVMTGMYGWSYDRWSEMGVN